MKYKMLYDLHTLTVYSRGSGSVEDNVREAIKKDLMYVAISDIGPGHIFYGVNRKNFANMRNDVEKINVKFPKMNIKLSIEANIINGGNGLDLRPEEFEEFDFVTAGYHLGLFGSGSVRNRLWAGGHKRGEDELRRKNTDMIVHALESNDIAVLTQPEDRCPADIARIADVCAETGTLMEINNRSGHLDEKEIKIAAANPDVKFIIGSGAHVPQETGTFENALERAFAAGLDVSRIVNICEVSEEDNLK